jgi:hypothetical protein
MRSPECHPPPSESPSASASSFKIRLFLFLAGLLGFGAALISLSSAATARNSAGERKTTQAAHAPVPAEPGVVRIQVTEKGFTPSTITLSPGVPTELEFLRTTEETCASSVVFPELGLSEPLALNEPVRLKVPAMGPRTLSLQCGVGDHRSAVIIN